MKAVYWLPVAALAGVVVGSWSSQEELQAYRDLGSRAAMRGEAKGKNAGLDAFTRMVRIPDVANTRKPATRSAVRSEISVTNRSAAVRKEKIDLGEDAEDSAPVKPKDLGARIEEAQSLWGARVDVARAQWKARLKLEGAAADSFDSALQEMNERLYESVAELAEIVDDQGKLTPETGLRLMGETATVMAGAYDRIGACVAPELRGDVSEINMVDFIDPGVAEPLVGVQDKLDVPRSQSRKGSL